MKPSKFPAKVDLLKNLPLAQEAAEVVPGFSHRVQFYDGDEFLAKVVSEFVGAGLGAGEAAIVVATPEHVAAIRALLAENGLDIDSLVERKRFIALDARETLASIMVGRSPSATRFRTKLGGLIGECASGGRHVRAFGEMVALLWADGNLEAAIRLEELWNELAKSHRFSLLCAYPMSGFGESAHRERFAHICDQHTGVNATEWIQEHAAPDDKMRAIAELQQKARALEAEVARRENADVELARRERELAAFVETAAVGLHWVGQDGTILWANAAEMALLGYSPAEYIGHNISEFHVDGDVLNDILSRLGGDEKLRDYEARMRCKDGSIKTVLIDSSVLREDGKFVHTQCFTRDISHQKHSDLAARHHAAIVGSSDDAIVSKDLNGVITSWNKGAERIFGYTEEEAIGQPVLMLIPIDRKDEEPGVLARIRAGERIDHYQTVRQRKDGSMVDISLTVSPIYDENGRIVGASKIARDISHQVQDHRALSALAADLSQVRDELEQRVEERTASLKAAIGQMEEFSYTVSHDLRAPLRAMDMYANVLLEEFGSILKPHPEAIHYLERISENCGRLDQMIRDVLTFSRVARENIVLTPVSLDRLIDEMVHQNPSLQPPHAVVTVEPLGKVLGHEPSLVQVFSNLFENALKFVKEGEVPTIRIRAVRRDGLVRISVQDNGIGIDPRYHGRLFGMFERLHPDLEYPGTGVGLAIARKATHRMGGIVGVESDGRSGSTFWIELADAPAGAHA